MRWRLAARRCGVAGALRAGAGADPARGQVLAIARCGSDGEAVALANDCAFGLGSAVFSRSQRRANAIGAALEARAQRLLPGRRACL